MPENFCLLSHFQFSFFCISLNLNRLSSVVLQREAGRPQLIYPDSTALYILHVFFVKKSYFSQQILICCGKSVFVSLCKVLYCIYNILYFWMIAYTMIDSVLQRMMYSDANSRVHFRTGVSIYKTFFFIKTDSRV